jgi:hypothetical protein
MRPQLFSSKGKILYETGRKIIRWVSGGVYLIVPFTPHPLNPKTDSADPPGGCFSDLNRMKGDKDQYESE